MRITLNLQLCIVGFLFFIVLINPISAQTNRSLFDVPTSENVLKNVKGKNKEDTYAKQRAALTVMQDVSRRFQYVDGKSEIVDKQLEEYRNAVGNVRRNYLSETNNPDKWQKLWKNYYYHTPEFSEEMIELLLSDEAKEYYYAKGRSQTENSIRISNELKRENEKIAEAKDKENQKSKRKLMNQLIFGIGLLIAILILIKARNWNRKLRQYEFENITEGGVVQFTTFKAGENHRKNKQYAGWLWSLGCIITIFMIIALLLQ